MGEQIKSYKDLRVYIEAFTFAMEIFHLTKKFPNEEIYSLIDQMRRSSRSVCLSLGEAWGKRKYPKYFVAKLTDCESEACETQISACFAKECGYITNELYLYFEKKYDNVIGMLVRMSENPEMWKPTNTRKQ